MKEFLYFCTLNYNKMIKKAFQFLPVVIAVVLVLLFSSCDKETTFPVKIICNFSETGIDTGDVVIGAVVQIGKDNYAAFAQAEGNTNATGSFSHTFPYEALLDVKATYSFTDSLGVYRSYIGAGQVKLMPNEEVEKTILMIQQ